MSEENIVSNVSPEPIVNEVPAQPVPDEPTLAVDVSFDDAQLSLILGAGFDPAQVRNEFGLVKVAKLPPITLSEAIKRATEKYKK